ncbi:MAG TPA: hypothetical protein VHY58_06450 [Streptosporangiaceae bacterium]|jgi:hypothetical protein|nr:hypothetical protein [Streptosporangiaceae bacterium]
MIELSSESKARVETVLRRAADDVAFREQLLAQPAAALEGTNLTLGEREILRPMRCTDLEDWGVDVRKFRTFLTDT